eukprot:CAMPEP_0202894092 /NCGR_PEP_ID=MMETSP1392-20130828/3544_1 /ASSEMBLY_ACC=CAM_ASM_000868 /TAXON_ID=225041 /ORGANISM="Chlamydomonas chlamydogama, Strain SAG 11-48b" /LENGTH=527 /DNA_ID=CAMNT_0049578655 /DNA_START=122 /DNA_END=1701 /DNA_ORIENTATION=-
MESSCRNAIKERVLKDMLGSIKGSRWKVLILDDVTTKVLSSSMRMSDIQEHNVSLVESIGKVREPLPLTAVYFLQPTEENIERIISDFDPSPIYHSCHIFFSSHVKSKHVEMIQQCDMLVDKLRTLKETNLEFMLVDSRTVMTDQPDALVRLMGANAEERSRKDDVNIMVSRLATLFSTLSEYPVIRYRQGRIPQPSDPPGAAGRSTLAERVCQGLLEKLKSYQKSGVVPSKPTCDVLVLDRSFDPLAPVIHEWTYEAMVYDLLKMEGNMFKYQAVTGENKTVDRESVLDESDPLWLELRHTFIAEVYQSLAKHFQEAQAKNKKATGNKSEMSMAAIRSLITALPQFRDILSRLSLHIQISSDIKLVSNQRSLTDVGELEQDLVLGEKNSKDLISFLADPSHQLAPEDCMRLFMCYLATHPEKMDPDKRQQWQTLAKLSPRDMDTVFNLGYLGVQVMKLANKPEKGGLFGKKDKRKTVFTRQRKEGWDEESGYALFRIEPLLKDLVTDLVRGRLDADEYPYVEPPPA